MTTQGWNSGDRRSPGWLLLIRVLAPVAAFLVVGLTVVGATRAAFSDTTDNASNTFSAGTVAITDDDTGSAMFSVSNMKPGDSSTECIEVSYDGTIVPADVNLYTASGGLTGTNLDDYLTLTINQGTGGSFGNCTGFSGSQIYTGTMDSWASTYTDFASGAGTWAPVATSEVQVYQFVVTLQDNNAAQGLNATITFTWEAQNQ